MCIIYICVSASGIARNYNDNNLVLHLTLDFRIRNETAKLFQSGLHKL